MGVHSAVTQGVNRIWSGGLEGLSQVEYLTNGVDIKPAMIVTELGETAGTRDIDICGTLEMPAGVMLHATSNAFEGVVRSLDTALQNDEACVVQRRAGGIQKVWVIYNTGAATCKRGEPLVVVSAGKVGVWVYTTAGDDWLESGAYIIGHAAQDITTDASDDQLVEMYI